MAAVAAGDFRAGVLGLHFALQSRLGGDYGLFFRNRQLFFFGELGMEVAKRSVSWIGLVSRRVREHWRY